ncbi:MAG: DUF1684 domain-containing protein [Actinobacteria bacterium]|nr:DUF1684 domain-containing protein [Actinomycetota bacterium]
MTGPTLLDLADYRREVAELYAEVRQLGVGPVSHALWRERRDRLLATHPQSALPLERRDGFTGLAYYDYDADLAVTGAVEFEQAAVRDLAHSSEGTTRFVPIGTVGFELLGAERALTLFWLDAYAGGLFLPFRDATSGTETYGGGRYLLDGAKSADLGGTGDEVVLDLNFAYHPSCVHDPRWSCPLAPPENRLDVPVRGGERLASASVEDPAHM